MKLFKYIWRNASRNKMRSLLTVLSVGFSLALMTVLYGYLAMQDVWRDEAEANNRIVVMNIQGFTGKVPIAYVDRVRAQDGIKAAVPYQWYSGKYMDDTMPFAQFATDPEQVAEVWDEFHIDPAELEAFKKNREACLIDRRMAERRGWKIGDRIPLQSTFYQYHVNLEVAGFFDAPQPTESLWFHWKYLDEGLRQAGQTEQAGSAGTIFAKAESAGVIPGVVAGIDERFASSDNPTRTQTEAAFAQMFTDMLGNVQVYIRNIGLAVLFSLTLVAGNAMAMSLRERTTEIAVLKAIGFPRSRVLSMVLGESCLIAGIGGALGIIVGGLCLEMFHQVSAAMFPYSIVDMAGPWMLWILGVGIGIGFISGIVPAIQAARLSVIDGLRRVI